MCNILEDDRLNISDELVAWKAALRWLKTSNNVVHMTHKKVLKTIRFGLMTQHCFINIDGPH